MTTHRPHPRTLALALLATLASAAAGLAGAAEERQAVLDAQDRRWKATVDADVDTLGRMTTDDMTYTHSSARVDTKASFLDSLKSGRVDYQSIVPEERTVRLYGDAAVVAGIAHVLVRAEGNDIDVRLRFTELYVKQDGQWRMALWHSTRVP
jgi:hypothetical protein